MGNCVIMLRRDTSDARTYKQWEKVGRYPKKGSKAFHILKPLKYKVSEEDPDMGKKAERWVIYGFGGVPVFRYEDTEGEEIEHPDYTPIELPPLYEVADNLKVSVSYAPFADRVQGVYTPSSRSIVLMSHDERVFFHELAHAADDLVSGLKGTKADKEVVAETVAATLGVMYSGKSAPSLVSRAYIEGYVGEAQAAKAAMRVLGRVEKCLELILNSSGEVEEDSENLRGEVRR
jgi:hypothetical protein